ncbi:TonB-dependent receptor [Microbulbifer hainanensis]|uniref:TonB-dependent receptor n=1 Tax=Microbulbifer hainanensis TaxID=2735675 RepID=UPI001867D347|nr:TonB-dependent receptor [Microbulbifer hainanensis]
MPASHAVLADGAPDIESSAILHAPITFAIDAQPLDRALTRFADQSGVQIFYRSQLLPQVNSAAVNGTFTLEEALRLLLSRSHLSYRFDGNDTLVLRTAEPDKAATAPTEIPGDTTYSTLEETYVTGVRSTLRRSLSIKRQSDNLVDVITSEDIGKFPDQNVADSLQRIAGVSVDRLWGEGRDVNIRGTDKDINRTLLNGQHVASAYWWANDNLSRGFNYSTLASQLVQSLEVHKTPRADLDEGSIGGTVIVRTRKPLDMAPLETHLSLERQYSELADQWDPQASFLGSWKNSAQTLGLLTSINWQNRSARRDGLETFSDNNLYRITDTKGRSTDSVYAIWGGGTAMLQQQRTHTTGNVTLQWGPDEHWDTVLNLVRSQLDIDNTNHNFLFSPGGYKLSLTPPAEVEDPQFIDSDDGNLMLAGGTLMGADSTGALLDAIQREAYIDTSVNDVDIHYRNDRWQGHLQFGNTHARGGTDHDRLYRFTGNSRVAFRLDRNAIETDYLDIDPLHPGDLDQFSPVSRDWIRAMENREDYGQLDFTRVLGDDWLQRIRFGVKYRDHGVENNLTVGSIDSGSRAWATLQQVGLDSVSREWSPELSQQSAAAGTLTRYALTDPQLLRSVIQPLYDAGAMTYHYDPSAYFRITEHSLAEYIGLDFARGSWSGNAGVRAVATRQVASAYRDGELQHVRNRYRDYLPSINVDYRATPDVIVRGALAQVMARPNFKDLSPSIIIDPTSGSGSAGNPYLDPYRADQLDLGIEWYFAAASLLSAAVFYKDISTFIYPHVETEMIDGNPVYITRPQNGPGADIAGLELQWQQDFANGFGVIGNYTYTDASVPTPDGSQSLELPGNSRSQFNASVYYEQQAFSSRLSYNYRSRSYGEIVAGSQSETAAYRQWDASVQWPLTSYLTLSAEAINLTDEVIYIRSASGIPQGFYENGRRFLLGLRLEY